MPVGAACAGAARTPAVVTEARRARPARAGQRERDTENPFEETRAGRSLEVPGETCRPVCCQVTIRCHHCCKRVSIPFQVSEQDADLAKIELLKQPGTVLATTIADP
jgi:hypothetical protein